MVEADEGAHVPEAVSEYVGGRIARFKRPHHVAFVDQLPRDDTGDVDRDAVKGDWAARFSG